MLHLSASVNYYFYSHAVDMRKGFDNLSGLVLQHMQLNVLNGGILGCTDFIETLLKSIVFKTFVFTKCKQ